MVNLQFAKIVRIDLLLLLFYYRRNIYKSEEKELIKISKDAAHKLNKEYGVKFGENGISKTTTKHPNYYLCESEYNLRSLLSFYPHDQAKKLLDRIDARKRYFNKKNNRKKGN